MYDDTELRNADADVAEALLAGLQTSRAGAGALYQALTLPARSFDLSVTVMNSTTVDYYGTSDIVYKGAGDSFLLGPDSFNLTRVGAGLALRITLNLGHATESGQRLSTMVHEVGVHCTRLFAAIVALMSPGKTRDELTEVLKTQYINGLFSPTHHHISLGDGTADDYYELKAQVTQVLIERSTGFIASIFGPNRWADLRGAFTTATQAGERGHAKLYPHPEVVWAKLEAQTEAITRASDEFHARAEAHQGGLVSVLSSFTSLFGGPRT